MSSDWPEEQPVDECPLCDAGREALQAFEWKRTDGGLLTYEICRRCGLVFQSPRLTDDALRRYYRDHYHQDMAGDSQEENRNAWVQEQRATHLVNFLEQHLGEIELHLDLGCSRGSFMQATQAAFGATTVGVEPGEEHRRLAQEKGLDVSSDMEELDPAYRGSADLVSLSHVLEHVPSPASYLRGLSDVWIRPQGHLLVEVPSLYWHPSYERAHLSAFSPATLRTTLALGGFEVVTLEKHGRPYSRTIPLFLLALARPLTDRTSPRLQASRPLVVKLRRRLGLTLLQFARWAANLLRSESAMRPWEGTE